MVHRYEVKLYIVVLDLFLKGKGKVVPVFN
jgi:hypothetical protein